MSRERIRIQFCPACGSNDIDIQAVVSKNVLTGKAGDYYCRKCESSGLIDMDGTFTDALNALNKIPEEIKKAITDAGFTIV